MAEDLSVYLSGEKLYGDDFTPEQIAEWFHDEKEGYADLGSKNRDAYQYAYHELNRMHGYRHLGTRRAHNVLGFGSAYGDEFLPIAGRIDFLTILDPSDVFAERDHVLNIPCKHVKPDVSGRLPFRDGSFDLIVGLGVMHHIPNVSYVMSECFRSLADDGIMLIREPIVSMGDWSKPRAGLTKRERGIPLDLLEKLIRKSGFTVRQRSLCVFPLIPRLAKMLGVAAYNDGALTLLDAMLSRIFSFNAKYHRVNLLEKIGPVSAYFVLTK